MDPMKYMLESEVNQEAYEEAVEQVNDNCSSHAIAIKDYVNSLRMALVAFQMKGN